MVANKKNSIKTINQLLTAGFELFGEKGYHRSKLEDVAKLAGVSRGAIYWHFKDKFDFCNALMKKCVEIIVYDQLTSLDKGDDPKKKLTNLIKEQLEKYLYDKKYISIAKVYYRFRIEIDDPEFLKENIELQTNMTKTPIMEVIKQGKQNGQIRDDLNDEEIYTILTTIMGGLASLVYSSSSTLAKKVHREKIIDTMMESIFTDNR